MDCAALCCVYKWSALVRNAIVVLGSCGVEDDEAVDMSSLESR